MRFQNIILYFIIVISVDAFSYTKSIFDIPDLYRDDPVDADSLQKVKLTKDEIKKILNSAVAEFNRVNYDLLNTDKIKSAKTFPRLCETPKYKGVQTYYDMTLVSTPLKPINLNKNSPITRIYKFPNTIPAFRGIDQDCKIEKLCTCDLIDLQKK